MFSPKQEEGEQVNKSDPSSLSENLGAAGENQLDSLTLNATPPSQTPPLNPLYNRLADTLDRLSLRSDRWYLDSCGSDLEGNDTDPPVARELIPLLGDLSGDLQVTSTEITTKNGANIGISRTTGIQYVAGALEKGDMFLVLSTGARKIEGEKADLDRIEVERYVTRLLNEIERYGKPTTPEEQNRRYERWKESANYEQRNKEEYRRRQASLSYRFGTVIDKIIDFLGG